MDSFDSFVSVNLCGTPHQRTIGERGLRIISGAGEIYQLEGFWQLDPPETNVKIQIWTNDLDGLIIKIAEFCKAYQRYAKQESVFVTFKDKDRYEAHVVYTGEWDQLVKIVDRGSYLSGWFAERNHWDKLADQYDNRGEYNQSYSTGERKLPIYHNSVIQSSYTWRCNYGR